MNAPQHQVARHLPLTWSLGPFAIPAWLLAKIGVVTVIAFSFLRAAWNPEAGFPAIGFWLLLFIAAAKAAHDDDSSI